MGKRGRGFVCLLLLSCILVEEVVLLLWIVPDG